MNTAEKPVAPPRLNEDWLALIIGLALFALALAPLAGFDLLGWVVSTSVWMDVTKALGPVSKKWAGAPGPVYALATFAFLLIVLSAAAAALRVRVRSFAAAFTGVFWISYAAWICGSWAHIAATPDKLKAFSITWSLNLTSEAGFIVALFAGLLISNFFPGAAKSLRTAMRSELYVKIAIVLLGGFLGVTAAEQLSLAKSVMLRGICAIIEAYLIYWAVVYYVARRYFGFSREWAAPLASGISICGVSAAIATGSAIRARPIVPIMVSSLVVIFAVVELLILPFVAQTFLYKEPMVAGAWMGLAVKTDGAAVAAGTISESLIYARAFATEGVRYQPGWLAGTTTTVKVFIDIFIGIWAFILAWIWSAKIDKREGERISPREIWQRFPKFVLGYVATFGIALAIAMLLPKASLATVKAGIGEANALRGIFFVMTFFSIGLASNFRKLWEEGIAKLAAVYVLCLFGFIIWFGLIISWLFFSGVKPPVAS
jgi:uncharacterized membrane protein YadS